MNFSTFNLDRPKEEYVKIKEITEESSFNSQCLIQKAIAKIGDLEELDKNFTEDVNYLFKIIYHIINLDIELFKVQPEELELFEDQRNARSIFEEIFFFYLFTREEEDNHSILRRKADELMDYVLLKLKK